MEKRIDTISGIPVYSYLNPHLHKFCLCMYVKGGSMYERKTENGISHFFEHVVIRNINVLMEGGLYQVLDRLGLSFNGCTYKEFIQFSISGASCHFQEAAGDFCAASGSSGPFRKRSPYRAQKDQSGDPGIR